MTRVRISKTWWVWRKSEYFPQKRLEGDKLMGVILPMRHTYKQNRRDILKLPKSVNFSSLYGDMTPIIADGETDKATFPGIRQNTRQSLLSIKKDPKSKHNLC
jgi:hypothetical protein